MDVKRTVCTCLLAAALPCAVFTGCSQAAADAAHDLMVASVNQVLAENPGSASVESQADVLLGLLDQAAGAAG